METTQLCPKCKGQMKIVPAGISKSSGNPYGAFLSCLDRKCGGTSKLTGIAPQQVESVVKVDYEKVMDRKADSIALSGSVRDAVQITLAIFALKKEQGEFQGMTTQDIDSWIKEEVNKWRSTIYDTHSLEF